MRSNRQASGQEEMQYKTRGTASKWQVFYLHTWLSLTNVIVVSCRFTRLILSFLIFHMYPVPFDAIKNGSLERTNFCSFQFNV